MCDCFRFLLYEVMVSRRGEAFASGERGAEPLGNSKRVLRLYRKATISRIEKAVSLSLQLMLFSVLAWRYAKPCPEQPIEHSGVGKTASVTYFGDANISLGKQTKGNVHTVGREIVEEGHARNSLEGVGEVVF